MKTYGAVVEKVLEVLRLPADFLLSLLASGDVLEAIDRALDAAGMVAQSADVHQGREARAIRPRHDYFGIPGRRSQADCCCHGTLIMGDQSSIEQVELV